MACYSLKEMMAGNTNAPSSRSFLMEAGINENTEFSPETNRNSSDCARFADFSEFLSQYINEILQRF